MSLTPESIKKLGEIVRIEGAVVDTLENIVEKQNKKLHVVDVTLNSAQRVLRLILKDVPEGKARNDADYPLRDDVKELIDNIGSTLTYLKEQ